MATLEHGWNVRKWKARIRRNPFRDDKFLQGIAMANDRSFIFSPPSWDGNTWIQSVAMVIGLPFFSVQPRNIFSARLFSLALEEPFLEAEASQTCNNSDLSIYI